MFVTSIPRVVKSLRRASELALSGAQMRAHGKKKIVLKTVIIVEVGKQPIAMIMTEKEFQELLNRPEVRSGRQKASIIEAAA
jgi:hypothetical protein